MQWLIPVLAGGGFVICIGLSVCCLFCVRYACRRSASTASSSSGYNEDADVADVEYVWEYAAESNESVATMGEYGTSEFALGEATIYGEGVAE